MKRKLLFTCMLVLGMLSVPVKVIGQKVLPEKVGNYSYTVEGTAGTTVKWRVYPESQNSSYARIYFSSNASSPVVENSWSITNTSSVTITTLFQNIKYADLSYYQMGEYPRIGKINANAFSQFKNLISVILPWRRDFQIGDYAFNGCGSLTSVYAYTNAYDALSAEGLMYVSNVGVKAFMGTSIRCSKIGTDALSLGTISTQAFDGCTGITELTIDNVSNIESLAFGNCSYLARLTFGDDVYAISSNAFKGCANLQAIHIGKNVPKYTCWNTIFPASLGALETITVSADNANYLSTATNCLVDKKDFTLYLGTNNSVIPNTVKIIGVDAFNGCSGLSTINIPASVTEIKGNAFLNCTRLASVWCESETPASIQTTSFKNIYSNAVLYVPTIDAAAAYEDSDWSTYFSEIKIGKKEENGMSWGLIPYGTETGKYTLWISGIKEMEDYKDANSVPWSNYADKIVAVELPSDMTHIGSYAFAGLNTVSVDLPSALVSIADNAFNNCVALKSITIPKLVETIGEYCFASSSALESVTFEEGSKLTSIGNYAFWKCGRLKNITIPASVGTIGEYCFYYCSALESVTFEKDSKFEKGSKLTTIGNYAFSYCNRGLKSIIIPASVETIGQSCFSYCSALESVTFEEGSKLSSIAGDAFYRCVKLLSITIPASVETIGESCFNLCATLNSVTFEEGSKLSSIANSAFIKCSSLQSITIPASVVTIGQKSFAECSKLSSVTIGESVKSIGESAFSGILDGAVITCLSYEQKIVDVQESSFNPKPVLRVYYTPNYIGLSSYFSSVEGIPVTITDGEVDEYEDIYEEDILLSCMEYKRTLLADSKWNALYVPFEIPVADIVDKYDVAYINDVRLYDSDNDGEIDENAMEVEVVYVKSGTLHANTPYLIRVKKTLSAEAKEAARAMNLALSTKLCHAKENVYDCSSLYKTFTFGGIYNKTAAEDLPGAYAISSDGIWHPMSPGSSLKPFRIYMKIENRGTPFQPDASEAGIRIRVAGEDNATGIAETEGDNGKAEIYDIAGRRVQNPAKGIYVVNGKKTVIK